MYPVQQGAAPAAKATVSAKRARVSCNVATTERPTTSSTADLPNHGAGRKVMIVGEWHCLSKCN